MYKFELLKEPFVAWVKEKREIIKKSSQFDLKSNEELILKDVNIDITLLDEILRRFSNMGPPSSMEGLLKRLIYFYNSASKKAPIVFDTKLVIDYMPNALEWTLVNVSELNFFDMSDIKFKKPYNQCYYCGKPDKFEHKTGTKKFNKKIKYCHSFDCDGLKHSNGSNPMLHSTDCCYRKYAISKKRIYQQLSAPNLTEENMVKIFLDYCEKTLKENMGEQVSGKKTKLCDKGHWTIQTENQKAKYIDEWWD